MFVNLGTLQQNWGSNMPKPIHKNGMFSAFKNLLFSNLSQSNLHSQSMSNVLPHLAFLTAAEAMMSN